MDPTIAAALIGAATAATATAVDTARDELNKESGHKKIGLLVTNYTARDFWVKTYGTQSGEWIRTEKSKYLFGIQHEYALIMERAREKYGVNPTTEQLEIELQNSKNDMKEFELNNSVLMLEGGGVKKEGFEGVLLLYSPTSLVTEIGMLFESRGSNRSVGATMYQLNRHFNEKEQLHYMDDRRAKKIIRNEIYHRSDNDDYTGWSGHSGHSFNLIDKSQHVQVIIHTPAEVTEVEIRDTRPMY